MMTKPEKIAAIAAITQVFKYYNVPSRFCPMISLAVGGILEYGENPTSQGILNGIILGALVTGSYGIFKGSAKTIIRSNGSPPAAAPLEPDDFRGIQ